MYTYFTLPVFYYLPLRSHAVNAFVCTVYCVGQIFYYYYYIVILLLFAKSTTVRIHTPA